MLKCAMLGSFTVIASLAAQIFFHAKKVVDVGRFLILLGKQVEAY